MTFNLADEEPFLRTLLDDPADTFTRAVYADWLEERGDIRSHYLRCEVLEDSETNIPLVAGSYPHPGEFEAPIDSRWPWLAFIETLGVPMREAIPSEDFLGIDPADLPLSEPLGFRGALITFASEFRDQSCWDAELLTDLMLLGGLQAEFPESGGYAPFMYPFLCEISKGTTDPTSEEVLWALKPKHPTSELGGAVEITAEFEAQEIFIKSRREARREDPVGPSAGNHGLLQRYVHGGRMWYARFTTSPLEVRVSLQLAVGLSPSRKRLLGIMTSCILDT